MSGISQVSWQQPSESATATATLARSCKQTTKTLLYSNFFLPKMISFYMSFPKTLSNEGLAER